MGFTLQGIDPRDGAVPVSRPLLSRRYGNPSLSSLLRRRRKPGESIGHRALLSAQVRTRPHGPKTGKRADALMGLGLPRVFSPCNRRGARPRTPTRFSRRTLSDGGQIVCDELAPRSVAGRGIGLASLEASDPSKVSNLIVKLANKSCAGQSRMNSPAEVGASPS